MLKVAVIGCGGIGKTHARHYNAHPEANLLAVCDAIKEKADEVAAQYGINSYGSVEELLKNEELDAVSVATAGVENGSHHFEPTMQVLAAKKHVLCEKPISNDIEHAREMVRAAKENGVKLGINLNHRFTDKAEVLKAWQDEGRLGDVLFINMALWINNQNESSPWFHIRALHPHSIDVMRFFGGEISKVQCFMHKAPNRQIWSTLSLNVQFASGAVGHLTGSYDASMNHPIERCEVMGLKGRGVIENVYERLDFFPREDKAVRSWHNGIFGGMGSFDDTFKNRIHLFVDEVLAGEVKTATGAEGLAAQEVIEAAIRSYQNGTVEDVPAVGA
jgi:predicted dehydrogenase